MGGNNVTTSYLRLEVSNEIFWIKRHRFDATGSDITLLVILNKAFTLNQKRIRLTHKVCVELITY